MAGNVDILRRYNSKYPLRDTQVKSIKVVFEGASEKQRRLKACVEQLLGAVFAAYKRNGFENNKKLDLYQSYKFLSNIADENKDFVKMLVENRDRLLEESDTRLDELVKEGSGIGEELFKKSSDRLLEVFKSRKSDVCAILDELLRDYVAKHPDDKTAEAESGTKDAKKRLEEMEKAIDAFVGDKARAQANDGIQKFRTSVFRSVTGMLEKFSRITFGKRAEGQAALLPTSGKLDETPKEDAKILRDELKKTTKDKSKFQKNLDKTGAAVAKTFSILGKNENSRSAKMWKILVMTIAGVRRMDTRGILGLGALWRRGAAGKIGAVAAFGAVSAFKLGSFAVESAFSITKSIIGGVWSLGKGIVGGVSRAVSGIYKNYMKPILPMLFKFMITPQGAFITGYLSHMVVSKAKKLFSKVTGFDGKKIKELFLGMLEKVTTFIGNINFKQLFAAISFAGSTILYPLVKHLIEGLLPENLVWRGAKSILGNALGWVTHSSKIMGLAKTAMLNPMTWLFTASVGTFVAMGNQITNTIDKVQNKQEAALLGKPHEGSLKRFQGLKNKFEHDDRGFMARNRNLILQATRAGAQASVQLNKDGTLGADAILREAAESAARDADEKVELDKILNLCHDESEELEKEQKSLSRLTQGNPSEEDKLKMGCDMDMVYNGEHVKIGRLPEGTVNPLGVRARNLIGRTRLLQMLKDRKFRDDPNASPNADAEIKKYREAAERLLVVNDGKAEMDEDVLAKLGEKMKYFQADTGVILDESGKPIRRSIPGWEIGREGTSYGFKEVENAGAIDWSDPMNAVAVMNNTLGKMMQDSETREQADMFGAREMGVGEDEITKPLFLELCDIFIDMMCDVKSHITAPGYATPRSPSRNIDLILKSKRVESRVKADGRIKEAKVEYNPKDAKMTEFFNMLATRSEKFRGYVGGIVGQEVVGCIGGRFTVISGVEGFHGRQDMVCIAPTKTYSTYTLYKNTTTFTLDEYNQLLKSNSLPKAMCAGGDRFCYLAMLDDKVRQPEPGPGDSFMCNVQFVGTSHGMAMDEMADRLTELLIPYILKYNEIRGQLEKGAKLGNFSDNPAEYVFNAFQAAAQEVGKFVQEKFDLSQAQIRGDQIEKERLMTEMKDMAEKFGEKYKEQSKKTEEVVKAISKAQTTAAKGEAPSDESRSKDAFDISVAVVDEFDHHKVNKATGKGRDRGSEERNASAVAT